MTILNIPPVGPKGDHLSAQGFIHDMFIRGIPPGIRQRCFFHFTCATDTRNIKKVFEDVRKSIMANNINGVGAIETT